MRWASVPSFVSSSSPSVSRSRPTNGVDPLGDVDQVHDGAPVAFIADGRDIAGRFIEHDGAISLRLQRFAIDFDAIDKRVGLGAQFAHDLAVNATRPSRMYCSDARREAMPCAARMRCKRSIRLYRSVVDVPWVYEDPAWTTCFSATT